MKNKVILISVDGMRPDGFLSCSNPYISRLMEISEHTLSARSCLPSITLPCHLSIFLSVPPERHGTLTNEYVPTSKKFKGLFELLRENEKSSAMFYGWDEMRDVSRPGSITRGEYVDSESALNTDTVLTDLALDYIEKEEPDFVFLYLVETDTKGGHTHGWMSEEYIQYISVALDNVKRVIDEVGDRYTVIITADHGGHGFGHGDDSPEDMNIPMFFVGERFAPGKSLDKEVSLLDIAPTVADIMGIFAPQEWEGKSILE